MIKVRTAALVVSFVNMALMSWTEVLARTYTSNFPLTENPISEGGNWINGKATGLDWNNIRTTSGLVYGTQTGSTAYDDSIAVLTGSWGPNQTAQATVHSVQDSGQFEEVELLLRFSISAHSAKGYECNFSVKSGNGYCQIVRWNGPLGNWTLLDARSATIPDGATVKATMAGNVISIFINGSQIFQVTDGTYASGSPGIGFYLQGGTGAAADYGFKSYTVTDGVAPPANQPPVAVASAAPTSGVAPLAVAFSSAGSSDPEGKALSYNWTFGDGATSTAANPAHTYSAAGVYSAQLTVSDGTNPTPSSILTITASSSNQPPVAVASATPTSGMAPLAVAFSSAGSSDPEGKTLSYNWVFGDGATSTAANPAHTFSAAGVYAAQLTVSDGTNSTPSSILSITVASPSSGVVAAYGLEEGSGSTITDSSGDGITGTISGAAWTTAGKYGRALSFNGTSSSVDLSNPALLHLTGSMAVSAWVKATGNPPDDGTIIAKTAFASGLTGWELKTTPDTGVRTFGVTISPDGNSYVLRYSKTVPSLNTWYYVAGVYSASAKTLDIYVNGVLDNGVLSGTVSSSQFDPNLNVTIGRRSSSGFYFSGTIDEVRVYNTSLTPAQIQADMAASVVRLAAPKNLRIAGN